MSAGEGGATLVVAVTVIRAAPDGFEPDFVLALLESDAGRRLTRLDLDEPPTPGTEIAC